MGELVTEAELRQMMPNAGDRLTPHLPYIADAMAEADINTPSRIAAFLAQVAHESGEYRYMEEIASGSAYEGRHDLGNIYAGDGKKYKGHGPIQITGRTNHQACGNALGLDLINQPTLITTPEHATRSATWFWNSRQLSLLADWQFFKEITRRINGGYTGLDQRVVYWKRNRKVLGLLPLGVDIEIERVKVFQADRGLTHDGIIGPRTMQTLAAEQQADQPRSVLGGAPYA
jgi:putative chitinase